MILIITLSCRQTSVNAHCCPAPFSGDNSKKNGEASLEYGQLGASRPPACGVQSKAWMALPYRGIPSVHLRQECMEPSLNGSRRNMERMCYLANSEGSKLSDRLFEKGRENTVSPLFLVFDDGCA